MHALQGRSSHWLTGRPRTPGWWEIQVLGKNGVTVNGALHTPSPSAVPLLSKDLITMGDSSFHFLLPAKRSRCCPPA